jgi:hypothetical protein
MKFNRLALLYCDVRGLARMFELYRDSMGVQVQVVQSLDEAYELLKVTPEGFTQRLFPEEVAGGGRNCGKAR